MQATVLSLFGAALAAGVCELLLPRENGGTAKPLRFVISLVVLLLILTPFLGFLQNNRDVFSGEIDVSQVDGTEFEKIFSETVNAQGRADLEDALYDLLKREHGIERKNAALTIRYDAQGELVLVSIRLSGAGLLQDPEMIENTLAKKLGCTVEVR